ncbi:hypothetical protein EYR38_004923 [Pleurotus pulmonarius]|nr:hypothetical protein EYR38_004923 [Pleurotus pulmonarius]
MNRLDKSLIHRLGSLAQEAESNPGMRFTKTFSFVLKGHHDDPPIPFDEIAESIKRIAPSLIAVQRLCISMPGSVDARILWPLAVGSPLTHLRILECSLKSEYLRHFLNLQPALQSLEIDCFPYGTWRMNLIPYKLPAGSFPPLRSLSLPLRELVYFESPLPSLANLDLFEPVYGSPETNPDTLRMMIKPFASIRTLSFRNILLPCIASILSQLPNLEYLWLRQTFVMPMISALASTSKLTYIRCVSPLDLGYALFEALETLVVVDITYPPDRIHRTYRGLNDLILLSNDTSDEWDGWWERAERAVSDAESSVLATHVWDDWCQQCSYNISGEDSISQRLYQAYNVRARPQAAERARKAWLPLLQSSLRRVVLGDERGVYTTKLGDAKSAGNKVHCFIVSMLEAIYDAQVGKTRIPNRHIFNHVEVSYVDVSGMAVTPFAMDLIIELQLLGGSSVYSSRDVDSLGEDSDDSGLDDFDAQDDTPQNAPILLITNAQRRAYATDRIGVEGEHVQFYKFEDIPALDGQAYVRPGDNELAAGSGDGSSSRNTAGASASAEDKAGAEMMNRGCGERAGFNMDDANNIDEDHEDADGIAFGAGLGNDLRTTPAKTTSVDEFGVLLHSGEHSDHADRFTIRARLVPSEAQEVLRLKPSKNVLHGLRDIFRSKQ